jgi:hypothetical protein
MALKLNLEALLLQRLKHGRRVTANCRAIDSRILQLLAASPFLPRPQPPMTNSATNSPNG